MRTILVHLNIEVPAGDERTVEEIAAAVEEAVAIGPSDVPEAESTDGLTIVVALAEEI